ncbi:MAG: hypothetical protein Q4C96_03190 [Planctomycetia bacterium]|nr:hypothetical protein [Planctomycetia bacterium]
MKEAENSGKKKKSGQITSILGIGFDNKDGQVRLTRGENYSLLGGSQTTHEIMQETAIKVNESLEKRGKRLDETSREEFIDVLSEVIDRMDIREEK